MIYFFGFCALPVSRYKAYGYFCDAFDAGSAAAILNREMCKWFGYGCKGSDAGKTAIEALSQSNDESKTLARLMALVDSQPPPPHLLAGAYFLPFPQVNLHSFDLETSVFLEPALTLDATFAPALCEQFKSSSQDGGLLQPPDLHALNVAFKRGFAYAGIM